MLRNYHEPKNAFIVNLSDDGKMNILGQIPIENRLLGDLSDKDSVDSFENLSVDKKKIFKAKRTRSKSPGLVNLRRRNFIMNLSPKEKVEKKSVSPPSLANLSPRKVAKMFKARAAQTVKHIKKNTRSLSGAKKVMRRVKNKKTGKYEKKAMSKSGGKKTKTKKSRSVSRGKIILLNLDEDVDNLSVSGKSIDSTSENDLQELGVI